MFAAQNGKRDESNVPKLIAVSTTYKMSFFAKGLYNVRYKIALYKTF